MNIKTTKLLLAAALFVCCNSLKAQIIIDSLENKLVSAKGALLIKVHEDLCWEYKFSNPDTSIYHGRKAIQYARKQNNQQALGTALNTLSLTYYYQGQINPAIALVEEAIKVDSTRQDTLRVAAALNKLGAFYMKLGNRDASINANLRAARIYLAKNMGSEAAQTLGNVGNFYYGENNYSLAMRYLDQAMEQYEKIKDTLGIASILTSKGNIYYDKKDFTACEESNQAAIDLLPPDKPNEILSHSYYGLGQAYLYTDREVKAISAFLKALAIAKQMNDTRFKGVVYNDLTLAYLAVKDLKNAAVFTDSAVYYAELSQSASARINAYQSRSKYYSQIGKSVASYEYFKKAFDLKDSISSAESQSKIADLEVLYQTELKETEIAQLNQQQAEASLLLARQQNWIISLLATIILLAGLASFLIYRRRKRAQQKLNEAELKHRKQLIKNTVNSQEEERKRIAKELHDGIAQSLVAIKMRFQYNILAKQKSGAQQTAEDEKSLELIDTVYEEVRGISHQMMPLKLTNQGLISALEELLNNTLAPLHIKYEFKHNVNLDERLAEHIEVALFRICQELVANILKHSHADKVHIILSKKAGLVHLTVEDNGQGMVVKEESTGIGLANIMARVKALNGKVEWVKSSFGGLKADLALEI